MASLTWTWTQYWDWYRQRETKEEKTIAMKELVGDGWLANLSAQIQAEVMVDAPMEILQAMKYAPNIFKEDTIILVEYMLRTKNATWRKKEKRR